MTWLPFLSYIKHPKRYAKMHKQEIADNQNSPIMKMFNFLVLFSLCLFPFSHGTGTTVQDFCVGDLTLPQSPSGFACRDPANVTADDFVFRGFTTRVNTSMFNGGGAFAATSPFFPGINGLNLIMARLDFDQGGVIPLHTHPRASEMLIVIQGTILTGFISSTNVPYLRTLNQYETMVFPQGLLHFQINVGRGPALAFVSLTGDTPGFQFTQLSLFANSIPTPYIEQSTMISAREVRRLKAVFGGSG